MSSGFSLPDGRDFDNVFTRGDGGQTTGFQTADGVDIGRRYIAGNSGITTGMQNSAGQDLGSLLGTYVPMSLERCTYSRGSQPVGEDYQYWAIAQYRFYGGQAPYTVTLVAKTTYDQGTGTRSGNAGVLETVTTSVISWGGYRMDCTLTIRDALGNTLTHTGYIA